MRSGKKIFAALCAVLIFAACVPSKEDVIKVLSSAEQTAAAQVTFEAPAATADVNVIVSQTFAAMTAQAGGVVAQPTLTQVAPSGQTGSISGALAYPAESIPALRVMAVSATEQGYSYVDTQPNQNTFKISGLSAGKYHVIAYTTGQAGFPYGFAGGYTPAVACGLSVNCTDHALIDVIVSAGADTPNINPQDWYAPEGSFPPMPEQGLVPPAPTSDGPPGLVGNGGILGNIQYPANTTPALLIVFFVVGGSPQDYYYITTVTGQSKYEMSLPPGHYYIVAYTLGGDGFPAGLAGGYTQYVVCGQLFTCTDHSLVDVPVASLVVFVNTADIADWVAPAGSFPPNPVP